MKLLEVLNDEKIKNYLFDENKINENPPFGNPHEFDEETLREVKYGKKKKIHQKPEGLKPYKPRKSTMDQLFNLEQGKEIEISRHIRSISTFPINSDTKESLTDNIYSLRGSSWDVLKAYLPFKNNEICRMSDEVQEEIISATLSTIRNGLRKNRHCFFHLGFMFEEDYEQEKLKYLVENGFEPIVLPEEDYEYLEEEYIKAIRKDIDILFEQAYAKNNSGNFDSKGAPGDSFFHFRLNCAKRFNYLSKNSIQSISRHFIHEATYNDVFGEKEITNYKELTICPITEHMMMEKEKHHKKETKESYKSVSYRMFLEDFIGAYPGNLIRLMGEKQYVNALNEVAEYIQLKVETKAQYVEKEDAANLYGYAKVIAKKLELI